MYNDGDKSYVVFNLCEDTAAICTREGSSSISTNNDCNSSNRRVIDMQRYLELATDYSQEEQWRRCEVCHRCYSDIMEGATVTPERNDDDDSVEQQSDNESAEPYDHGNNGTNRRLEDCAEEEEEEECPENPFDVSICLGECSVIENMQENGYIDAIEYIDCQYLDSGVDDDDDSNEALYAGAICDNYGRIRIGVFNDFQCKDYNPNVDIAQTYIFDDDGMAMEFSYQSIKPVTSIGRCAITCQENIDGGYVKR